MKYVRISKSFIIFFLMCLFQHKSIAAESVTLSGPIGGTDINSAILPPSGNYITAVAAGINIDKWYDKNGNEIDTKGHVAIGGVGILHVYEKKLFGGNIASSIFTGIQELCFGFDQEQCSRGFQDVYSDVFMWNKHYAISSEANSMTNGLSILTGLGLNLPLGEYTKSKNVNIGSNYLTISPNIGLTYTFKSFLPQALGNSAQLSGRLFYNYYTENKDTDYLTGSVLNLDFAATLIKNNWQYGIAGNTFSQLTDDEINGQSIKDTKAQALNLGPILGYNFIYKNKNYSAMLKAPINLSGENITKAQGLTFRVSTNF
ncbi:transporter [Acinetobacter sichuanensis]|uniref:Transporter n=1 Tax=Acinetobacter sichuanensis TaxID=2136183 RepID=A0A371YL79_9GAMM|nr:transporter [Acinetobacter sichuanensis]RFC82202.1 hypothetical protein C9E89_017775 [Acinetobacter sichuanensis]